MDFPELPSGDPLGKHKRARGFGGVGIRREAKDLIAFCSRLLETFSIVRKNQRRMVTDPESNGALIFLSIM